MSRYRLRLTSPQFSRVTAQLTRPVDTMSSLTTLRLRRLGHIEYNARKAALNGCRPYLAEVGRVGDRPPRDIIPDEQHCAHSREDAVARQRLQRQLRPRTSRGYCNLHHADLPTTVKARLNLGIDHRLQTNTAARHSASQVAVTRTYPRRCRNTAIAARRRPLSCAPNSPEWLLIHHTGEPSPGWRGITRPVTPRDLRSNRNPPHPLRGRIFHTPTSSEQVIQPRHRHTQ